MSQNDREAERQWARRMLKLEEERGPIVPGGAVGGTVARARAAKRRALSSAACRARGNVRFLARAIEALEEQAA